MVDGYVMFGLASLVLSAGTVVWVWWSTRGVIRDIQRASREHQEAVERHFRYGKAQREAEAKWLRETEAEWLRGFRSTRGEPTRGER